MTASGTDAIDLSPLFESFSCKSLDLANRVVMAPMTRMMSPDGIPTPEVAAYYRRRAENGVGLLITEGTPVHPLGSPDLKVPQFWGDGLAGWRRVVDEVHEAGGRIVPQLWHVGIERKPDGNVHQQSMASVSPSGVDSAGNVIAPPMTLGQIQDVIDAFTAAAIAARELGFDGIELHGAHGYLIDQFLRPFYNRRDDDYGGTLENRLRFPVELITAIRRAVGDNFAIALRFSQWRGGDYDAKMVAGPDELAAMLNPLADAGVDIFHCSTRRYFQAEFEGSDLNLAGWAKKVTGRAAMTVGGVGISADFNARAPESSGPQSIEPLVRRLAAGEFDLVAVGRALLTDPAWLAKLRDGQDDALQGFRREALAVLS